MSQRNETKNHIFFGNILVIQLIRMVIYLSHKVIFTKKIFNFTSFSHVA